MSRKGKLARNIVFLLVLGALCCICFNVYPSAWLAVKAAAYHNHILEYEIAADTNEQILTTPDNTERGGWWSVSTKANTRYLLLDSANALLCVELQRIGFLWHCTDTSVVEADAEAAVLHNSFGWESGDSAEIVWFGKVQNPEIVEIDAVFIGESWARGYHSVPVWSSEKTEVLIAPSASPYFLVERRYEGFEWSLFRDYAGLLPYRRLDPNREGAYEIMLDAADFKVRAFYENREGSETE